MGSISSYIRLITLHFLRIWQVKIDLLLLRLQHLLCSVFFLQFFPSPPSFFYSRFLAHSLSLDLSLSPTRPLSPFLSLTRSLSLFLFPFFSLSPSNFLHTQFSFLSHSLFACYQFLKFPSTGNGTCYFLRCHYQSSNRLGNKCLTRICLLTSGSVVAANTVRIYLKLHLRQHNANKPYKHDAMQHRTRWLLAYHQATYFP